MVNPDQDPIRRAVTKKFFRIVVENPDEYELFLSPVTVGELGKIGRKNQKYGLFSFCRFFLPAFRHIRQFGPIVRIFVIVPFDTRFTEKQVFPVIPSVAITHFLTNEKSHEVFFRLCRFFPRK
jgi:hypothetical protein